MSWSWEEEHLKSTECPFKKHKGEAWWQVIEQDRSYVEWVLENIEDLDEEDRDALTWGVKNVPDRI